MTHTEMSMTRMINFDKFVVNYINDNLDYINNAEDALQHIIESTKYDENAIPLTDEQKERFMEVAITLFEQGYVAHAGVLHNEDEEDSAQYVHCAESSSSSLCRTPA